MRVSGLTAWQRGLVLGGIVTLASLLLLLIAEGAVRLRHWSQFGDFWGIEQTYTIDRASGLRIPVPGARFGPISINSRGFRGPEIDVPKPPGRVRLAFLGASTTYSAEVSGNDRTWPHLVWRNLQSRWPGIEFDYVNAGVPGYGIRHSLRALQHRVAPLDPDVIVIYHAVNDLSVHSFRAARARGLVEVRTEQEFGWLARHLLLWYLVEKNLRIGFGTQRPAPPAGTLSLDMHELAVPFERDLRELVEACQQVAHLVVVVTFSPQLRLGQTQREQAAAAATNLYYMPYMSIDGLLAAFDAFNAAIRRVAVETGATLVGDEFAIPGDSAHFADSVHFTDLGSRRMAERIGRVLVESDTMASIVSDGREELEMTTRMRQAEEPTP